MKYTVTMYHHSQPVETFETDSESEAALRYGEADFNNVTARVCIDGVRMPLVENNKLFGKYSAARRKARKEACGCVCGVQAKPL